MTTEIMKTLRTAAITLLLLMAMPAFSQAPPVQEPSSAEDIQNALIGGVPMGRWKEGLLFDGIEPQPWLKSAANWFPNTEEINPNEMRVIFMGTSPSIRPGQMNTSILVQLGNGENFVFDLGEGSISNYVAAGIALNQIDKVFITHLHVDHFGSLPYLWMFGTWAGGWHEQLTVYGPSGRTPDYGTAKMVEVYDEDGVTVTHWQRSHAKDGASAYRLDWNDMCFVWTGDGRPNKLDLEYAKGCDLYVTETQAEVIAISSGVQGVPPFLGRYTVDSHHTPAYAAGYVANEIQPRLFMTTHMAYDPYQNEETVAEIRHHWKGPYHFGAPDGIVVNMTKDQIWVREGILPDFPNNRAPQFDFSNGQLVVPKPPTSREEIQDQYIRDQQIDPELYYPEGYHPELLEDWPVDSDLVIPLESAPAEMTDGMGAEWRLRNKNRKILEEQGSQ
jgi:ribonuclease BN (tRNA processing enzyme)